MKKLLVGNETNRFIKLSLHQIASVLFIMVLMVLLNGCASPYVYNIKPERELKKGQKVLTGRFACFDNDTPVTCTRSGFDIFFNREGDAKAKLFSPDDAGYVYIAVTEGYYNFGTFAKGGKDGSFIFNLDTFPVVLVRSDDSVVNFGTLEVRFYQRRESIVAPPSSGADRANLRVNHIPNYDVIRPEIASRVGKSAGSISNGRVQFLQRARR